MRNLLLLFSLFVSACAQLHHVQVGEVVSQPGYTAKPFDIKISETGINIQEGARIAGLFAQNSSQSDALARIAAIVSLFQMGPRTGNGVFVKDYAENLILAIYDKCPSGNITGILSVRETRKYPVISGEIVKVTGYCMERKNG